MKQSIIFSILSMALAVSASPTNGGGKSGGGQCNGGNNKQVCCNGLGGLSLVCIVQALGGACDGSKKCCSTKAATVSIFRTFDPIIPSFQLQVRLFDPPFSALFIAIANLYWRQGALVSINALNCVSL
jgi:hypothetical protein